MKRTAVIKGIIAAVVAMQGGLTICKVAAADCHYG
jgi:hypothetical protein